MKLWNKGYFIVLLSMCLNIAAQAFDLNKHINLVELSSANEIGFEIMSHGKKLGAIYRQVTGYNVRYGLYDKQSNLESSAELNFSPNNWDINLNVFDSQNIKIGSIRINIFDFITKYKVYTASECLIATSYSNFWSTIFDLHDENEDNNPILASMHQSFLRPSVNRWNIDLVDLARIDAMSLDKRLLLMLFAAQADKIFQQQITADYKRDEYNKNQDGIDYLDRNL